MPKSMFLALLLIFILVMFNAFLPFILGRPDITRIVWIANLVLVLTAASGLNQFLTSRNSK